MAVVPFVKSMIAVPNIFGYNESFIDLTKKFFLNYVNDMPSDEFLELIEEAEEELESTPGFYPMEKGLNVYYAVSNGKVTVYACGEGLSTYVVYKSRDVSNCDIKVKNLICSKTIFREIKEPSESLYI
ncbi:MAG: hypothetical protein PHW96_04615 [Candidatus Nanoarchaeia archaeon]|nr:hypothetical protein [Candidatus Nanoarchaeia archaeon]